MLRAQFLWLWWSRIKCARGISYVRYRGSRGTTAPNCCWGYGIELVNDLKELVNLNKLVNTIGSNPDHPECFEIRKIKGILGDTGSISYFLISFSLLTYLFASFNLQMWIRY